MTGGQAPAAKSPTRVYLIGSPVGDYLEDFSQSALDAIRDAEVLFVEEVEDPHGDHLLGKLRSRGILTKEHTLVPMGDGGLGPADRARIDGLIREGTTFAVLADKGLPCFLDPGRAVVDYLWSNHAEAVELVPLGLASALDGALVLSGADCSSFVFLGHYPEVHRLDLDLASLRMPAIAYVRDDALIAFLRALQDRLGETAPACRLLLLANIRQREGQFRHWFSADEPLQNFAAMLETVAGGKQAGPGSAALNITVVVAPATG